MMFVLDASVTIVWAMRDEEHPLATLAARDLELGQAAVPTIRWYEVRNILLVNERRKRISAEDSAKFLSELSELPIEIEDISAHSDLSDLARLHALTVYDAAYLDLALRLNLPLTTLDKALRTAAEAAGLCFSARQFQRAHRIASALSASGLRRVSSTAEL